MVLGNTRRCRDLQTRSWIARLPHRLESNRIGSTPTRFDCVKSGRGEYYALVIDGGVFTQRRPSNYRAGIWRLLCFECCHGNVGVKWVPANTGLFVSCISAKSIPARLQSKNPELGTRLCARRCRAPSATALAPRPCKRNKLRQAAPNTTGAVCFLPAICPSPSGRCRVYKLSS